MNTYKFIIPIIASFSTILGIIPTYLKKDKQNNLINKSLSFTLGVMLTLSVISLIPEAISYQNKINIITILITLIFVVLGIILSQLIDSYINNKLNKDNLYKLGIISILAITLHNIPEGITTFLATKTNYKLG